MANRYKNNGILASIDPTIACTCPSQSKAVVVHSLFITNLNDASEIKVHIYVHTSIGDTFISKNVRIPVGSTLIIDKPLNLEPSDYVAIYTDIADAADVFVSYLEVY